MMNVVNQNENESTSALTLGRKSVRVERHLDTELELVIKLESLNDSIADMLADAGSGGLTPKQLDSLNASSSEIGIRVAKLQQHRIAILELINPNGFTKGPAMTIRHFIQRTETATQQRLERKRMAIVDRLTNVQAQMVGNQAVFFYSFDFYKKMLSGLLQTNVDQKQYRADGQSAGVEPGNFLRKAV